MLLSGTQGVEVIFTSLYDNTPFVVLTPVGKGVSGYFVDNVTTRGFTLKIEQTLSQDVMFNWSATQTSIGAVLGVASSTPTPTPSTSPSSPIPVSSSSPTPTVSPQPTVAPTNSTPSPVVSPTPTLEPSA